MPGFQYYIPKMKTFKDSKLGDFGLSYLEEEPLEFREVLKNGPDGGEGLIIAPRLEGVDSGKIGYFPAVQYWQKATNEKFFLGWEKGALPKPEDLRRKELIEGYSVELMDGNFWLVPLARIIPDGTKLPRVLKMASGGKVIQEVMPKYLALSKAAERVWEKFLFDMARPLGLEADEAITKEIDMDMPECFEVAALALGGNFKIGVEEISALGLFTDRNVVQVLYALIDRPKWQAEEGKKKVGGT